MEETHVPVTVVTGANSGIGRATALHLASVGHRVVGTVRAVGKAEKLLALAADSDLTIELVELDVGDDASVKAGFEQILEMTGRIDNLVNNAGVGGNAVVEECPSDVYLDVFNINVVGATRCTQAVLPSMRERGSGTIINITSVAGRIASLAQAPYVASKWALEGVSEELAQEVAAFGVRVAIIEPGVTKSSIFAKNTDVPNSTGAYETLYRHMFRFYMAGRVHATDPLEVGKTIEHAITTADPQLRYAVSWCSPEMSALHDRIAYDDWIELGKIDDEGEYAKRFQQIFGVEI